jgi:type IV pilus assembly protein PilC
LGQLFTTLSKSGLSIHEVIEITARGATSIPYNDALSNVGEQVAKGTTLASGLAKFPKLFPRDFTTILAVGERSGTLDESFTYLTEYYRKEVFAATKRLPTVIEPILLLVMGVMVAFIAIAIILPIYDFTSHVRR